MYCCPWSLSCLHFFVVVHVAVSVAGTAFKKADGIDCYDCNYAPGGEILVKQGWIDSKKAGHGNCALSSRGDAARVDKFTCRSQTCFIRLDSNGLLYRGCADSSHLPWSVDIKLQCKLQGPHRSLWWFCNTSLCNDGLIGEQSRCDPSGNPQSDDAPSRGTNSDHRRLASPASEVTSSRRSRLLRRVAQDGKEGKDPDSTEKESSGDGKLSEKDLLKIDEPGPCDGTCHSNPSGLFPHPILSDHFVHCGRGSRNNGRPCYCCQPYVVACPFGTTFDDVTKICVRKRN